MGLSSVFQVFQLALGPSLQYTMGAFKAGQYFREVLIGVPFHQNNRILVEFLGKLAEVGKINDSHLALISGLGGYIPGETRIALRKFFTIIHKQGGFQLLANTWPFNDETDVIFNTKKTDIPHPNTIRFHVLNEDGKVLTQSEYTISSKGLVSGPGSRDNDPSGNVDQIESFSEIRKICQEEKIELLEYIYSSERLIHSIPKEQTLNRLVQTWRIMDASIANGISNQGKISPDLDRFAHQYQENFESQLSNFQFLGRESMEVAIFASAVSEESLSNQLVITAPVCETSGVVAAVLKTMQKKYLLNESQLAEALLLGGFVGSILQKVSSKALGNSDIRSDFQIATAMAAAAGLSFINNDIDILNNCINIALKLSDIDANLKPSELPQTNLKHANLALLSINLSMVGYQIEETAFDRLYLQNLKNQLC